MRSFSFLFLLALAAGLARPARAQMPAARAPWVSDLGNGHYKNPVLYADYSDPDVVRVGADYYLTSSSFNAAPGLPILHSKDLVNWTLIGHALPRQLPVAVPATSDEFSSSAPGLQWQWQANPQPQ
jgi:beta-xylosidase